MSKVFIEESTLKAIGNAIRGKTGKTELINPTNMPAEISSIQSGSGLPAEALNITEKHKTKCRLKICGAEMELIVKHFRN